MEHVNTGALERLVAGYIKKLGEAARSRLTGMLTRADESSIDSPVVRRRNNALLNELLASGEEIRIEFGETTKRFEGWITADHGPGADLRLDLSGPLPLPSECALQVYSSHLLEHLGFPHVLLRHLRECHRILKPGGSFSVAVPNARIWIDAYLEGRIDEEKYCGYKPAYSYFSGIDYINYVAYMGGVHHHLFDQANLVEILREAGFSDARARDFDETLDLADRKDQSIYAEANKRA
jgi:predicted SAM-dependent methyltransferase